MQKVVKKKKINIFGFLIVLLIIYLISMFLYYLMALPIKNIYIKGNEFVSDATIIEIANIKDYPSLLKVSRGKIKKKLLKNPYIDNVSVKKSLGGKVTITVEESKPLFYNRSTNKIVLLNGKSVDSIDAKIKIPSLINMAPNDLYNRLIKAFNRVDYNIIGQISEIEYTPDVINDKTIDPERFYLRMVDGNSVYINPVNINRLNNYFEVYDRLPDNVKGTLYFDSNSDNNMFKMYGAKEASEVTPNEN